MEKSKFAFTFRLDQSANEGTGFLWTIFQDIQHKKSSYMQKITSQIISIQNWQYSLPFTCNSSWMVGLATGARTEAFFVVDALLPKLLLAFCQTKAPPSRLIFWLPSKQHRFGLCLCSNFHQSGWIDLLSGDSFAVFCLLSTTAELAKLCLAWSQQPYRYHVPAKLQIFVNLQIFDIMCLQIFVKVKTEAVKCFGGDWACSSGMGWRWGKEFFSASHVQFLPHICTIFLPQA